MGLTGKALKNHIVELIRRTSSSLPKDVVEAMRKMCAFDPKDRYASMDEVIEDLELIGDA